MALKLWEHEGILQMDVGYCSRQFGVEVQSMSTYHVFESWVSETAGEKVLTVWIWWVGKAKIMTFIKSV